MNDDESTKDAWVPRIESLVRTAAIEVWPYERFPFGMTLDYERKFVSYVP